MHYFICSKRASPSTTTRNKNKVSGSSSLVTTLLILASKFIVGLPSTKIDVKLLKIQTDLGDYYVSYYFPRTKWAPVFLKDQNEYSLWLYLANSIH